MIIVVEKNKLFFRLTIINSFFHTPILFRIDLSAESVTFTQMDGHICRETKMEDVRQSKLFAVAA